MASGSPGEDARRAEGCFQGEESGSSKVSAGHAQGPAVVSLAAL